jgi:site-specific recombinase XerD
VSAWRVSLEERRLGSSSVIIRVSAIRKLAAEAADNGLLAPELAAGISRVKSAKTQGIRVGNWLSLRQAQVLLTAPDITTLRGLRDRAILAILLGCGLRRSEVAALTFTHLQQRDGRWCVCRPGCQTQPSPHRTDANLGEGRNRTEISTHRRNEKTSAVLPRDPHPSSCFQTTVHGINH